VYIQAGAGIVADSDPEMEYEETRNKAGALVEALSVALDIS
jgi:anthranilate synthase component I